MPRMYYGSAKTNFIFIYTYSSLKLKNLQLRITMRSILTSSAAFTPIRSRQQIIFIYVLCMYLKKFCCFALFLFLGALTLCKNDGHRRWWRRKTYSFNGPNFFSFYVFNGEWVEDKLVVNWVLAVVSVCCCCCALYSSSKFSWWMHTLCTISLPLFLTTVQQTLIVV